MGAAAIPIIASGALGAMGGIFAPEGQELSSFENLPAPYRDLDPAIFADALKTGLSDYLSLAVSEAGRPVTVDTTAAPLPNFSGGGLPFTISAPAMDPGRRNPTRRTFAGPEIPATFAADVRGTPTTPGPGEPGFGLDLTTPPQGWPEGMPWPPFNPGDFGAAADPRAAEYASFISNNPGDEGRASDALGFDTSGFAGSGDPADLDEAEGAIELLMQQIRSGRG